MPIVFPPPTGVCINCGQHGFGGGLMQVQNRYSRSAVVSFDLQVTIEREAYAGLDGVRPRSSAPKSAA
jgi:hypothetical protein